MLLKNYLLYVLGIAGLRRSDVILTSFPRSGSTWMRFILCNYLSLKELEGREVDLIILDDIMPALGRSNLLRGWSYLSIPRFVKTHLANPIFFALPHAAVQIVRDPRDVMVSYYHYLQNHVWVEIPEEFSSFIRHEKYGLPAYFSHFTSWQSHNPYKVHYEALKEDPYGVMEDLLTSLGITIDNVNLREAVGRSSIRNMQHAEETSGISGPERFSSQFKAVRVGSIKQWPEHFSSEDLDYYEELCQKYHFSEYK